MCPRIKRKKPISRIKARLQILQGVKVVFEEGEAVIFGAQLSLKNFKSGIYELRLLVADDKSKNMLRTGKLFEIDP